MDIQAKILGYVRKFRDTPSDMHLLYIMALFLAVSLFAKFIYSFAYQPIFEPEFTDANFIDLNIFFSAAHATFNQGLSPYDVETLKAIRGPDTLPFLYPPPGLLQFYPLSWLTFEQAVIFQVAASHAALLGIIYLIARHFAQPFATGRYLTMMFAALFVMWFWPVAVTLKLGQINIFLAFFLTLFWVLVREKKDLSAGMVLALCVAIKTYPVLLGLPLLIHGRYRALAGAIGMGAALLIVTLFVVPFEAWQAWFHDVAPNGGLAKMPEGMFWPGAPYNQSLNGVFTRLFDLDQNSSGPGAQWARGLGYAAVLTVLVVSALAARVIAVSRQRHGLEWSIAIFFLAQFLIAPFTWNHHATYLLPVVVLTMFASVTQLRVRPISALIALGACLTLSLPLSASLLNFNVAFLAVFALWVAAVWPLFRSWLETRYDAALRLHASPFSVMATPASAAADKVRVDPNGAVA